MAEVTLPAGWTNFSSGCLPCVPVAPDGITEVDILFPTPPAANRVSWSFVADNPGGEIVYEVATNNPFPDNQQLYKSVNGVTTTETFPAGINPLSNLAPGISDRTLFAWASGGFFTTFDLSDNSMVIFALGSHGFSGSNVRNWSVNGSLMFLGGNDLTKIGITPDIVVAKYNALTGAFVSFIGIPTIVSLQTIHYMGEFVYVLAQFSATAFSLFKYDTDLNLLDTFALAATVSVEPYMAAFAETDDTVYVIKKKSAGAQVAISYVDRWTDQIVLDESVTGDAISTDASAAVMIVHADETTGLKYFYLGRQTDAAIHKYGPVECAS